MGGEVGFEGGTEVLVVGGDEVFKTVELGVLVDLPPFAAEEAVRGGGGLPGARGGRDGGCAGFFVDGRGGGGGAVVVGAYGSAGSEGEEGGEGCGGKEGGGLWFPTHSR